MTLLKARVERFHLRVSDVASQRAMKLMTALQKALIAPAIGAWLIGSSMPTKSRSLRSGHILATSFQNSAQPVVSRFPLTG